MKVSELWAGFRFKVDRGSLDNVRRSITGVRSMVVGLGVAFAARGLVRGFIGVNRAIEDAKINIQSMLTLARKNTLNENLADSVSLYDNLRRRAATLPGTVEEYVNAASKLTYPIISAGLAMKDLEDLTVGTIVAAKGLGYHVGASIRDVAQGLEGRYSSTDFFLKALLEPKGFTGEEGRKRFKSKDKAERATILKDALTQGAIAESAAAQAKTMTGQYDKAREALSLFLGRVGLPLFRGLKNALTSANQWLDKNRAAVEKLADKIGGVLSVAFGAIGSIIGFIVSDGDLATSILVGIGGALGVIAINSLIAAAPLILLIGRFALLAYAFQKLREKLGDIGAAIATVFGAALLFRFGLVVKGIKAVTTAFVGMRAASAGAGAAVNGMGAMTLGPAGRGAPAGAGAGAKGGMPVAAAAFVPFAIAMGVDAMLGRDEEVDATLGDWSAMKGLMLSRSGGETGKLGAALTNNTINIAPTTITINSAADAADIERQLLDLDAKRLRHLQVSMAGGKR